MLAPCVAPKFVPVIVTDVPTGPLVGASYTDVHIALPGLYLTAIAALLAAAWIIVGVMREKNVIRDA